MLLFFSLRPFPRHRMPVIFFALALLALLALFTSIVPIVPIVPCKFLHGKVDHLDKLRLLLGQLCQVCHAFFHHFIDRLDKNFSYSLYISYSFLIHSLFIIDPTSLRLRSHLFLSHYIRTIISHCGRHHRVLLSIFALHFCTYNHTDIQKKARHEISLMSSKKEICVRRLFLETRYKFFGALTRIPNICNLNTLLRFSIDDFCQMTN